ncbi:MAG: hypothetical protein AAF721_08475 [Myxococcota bacterium]
MNSWKLVALVPAWLFTCQFETPIITEARFEVRDRTGAPVPEATIYVHARNRVPGTEDTRTITQRTGVDGGAHVEAQIETRTGCPMCMHGMPDFGNDACAEHPELGATMLDDQADGTFVLEFGADDVGQRCLVVAGRLKVVPG